ncbi:hypothetical protein [Almyronema epifaneia]|uniref:Uncharacterized protein n=1 Tax=Almyronema epifaneia S1 TaxID=2991925 RepID=A0ABW6IAY4_9CYAN
MEELSSLIIVAPLPIAAFVPSPPDSHQRSLQLINYFLAIQLLWFLRVPLGQPRSLPLV